MTSHESPEHEYVLGTHDQEIERLGLQHRVWRPRVLDAWRRAGFAKGQTLIDLGCGPGYATLDLAEIVGPGGRVVAVDKSRRFLNVLEASCRERRVGQVTTQLLDLDETELPEVPLDGGWCRWVFAFVRHPRDLLARVARRLKPGAVFVVHEYFDYGTWRLAPRSAEHEEFVATVMRSWRDSGGEPDIGLQIPGWLNELGFAIRSLTPLVDVVPRSSPIWQWPRTFIRVGLERLVSLARMSSERAEEIWRSFEEREAAPGTLMVTPAVLEIVAERVAP